MNFSIREKVLLLVLSMIAIIFLGVKFLILPSINVLAQDNSQLSKVQLNVLDTNNNIVQSKGVLTKLQKCYDDAITAAAPLFPSLDKPTLHVWIFNLAGANGFSVQTATFSDPGTTSAPTLSSAGQPSQGAAATGAPASGTSGAPYSAPEDYSLKNFADQFLGNNSKPATPSGTSGTSGDVLISTVTLSMTGTYSDLKSFLDAIRDSKRTIEINSFVCTNQGSNVSCTFILQFYGAEKLDNTDTVFNWTLPDPPGKNNIM